jgi:membrane protein YdbS with pleckstrin-like domain
MFGVLAVKMPPPLTVESAAVYAFVTVVAASLVMAIVCIPFYRYRYLFRLKADNPDWSAGRCFRECAALVDGAKWRMFMHDCSYWRILLMPLLLCVLLCVAAVAAQTMGWWNLSGARVYAVAVGVLVLVVSYLALLVFIMVAVLYIGVGQTVLYREISAEKGLRRR